MTNDPDVDPVLGRQETRESASGTPQAHTADSRPVDDSPIIAVTMSANAADRFLRALSYAEAVVHTKAEANDAPATKAQMEAHSEWLLWGYNRIHNAAHP